MNKFIKKLIFFFLVLGAHFGFYGSAYAQVIPPLSVQFQNTPLFSEANFLPGDEVIRTVGVSNNSESSQVVIVEAINSVDVGGLGDKLHLLIKSGDVVLYEDTLGAFLRSGEVSLSNISHGSNVTYSFGVTFEDNATNDTQDATLGFDLCLGFGGGDRRCGNTVISGEENTYGGGGGSVIGGIGGSNGPIVSSSLIILNEKTEDITSGSNISPTATALITWNTNMLATSQVVYGPDNVSYNFNLNNLPAFGYPFYTPEDITKVTTHSVLLSGLIPGQTYVYRVVSRASPPTVSFEHKFTVPPYEGENLFAISTNAELSNRVANGGNSGLFLEKSDNSSQNEEKEVWELSDKTIEELVGGNLAAVFASGFGDLVSGCSIFAFLTLLLIYLIWKLLIKRRYERKGLGEEKIKTKFYIFSSLTLVLVIIVLIILSQYCPILILLLGFIASIVGFLYRLIFK